jgi:hypothetical protein
MSQEGVMAYLRSQHKIWLEKLRKSTKAVVWEEIWVHDLQKTKPNLTERIETRMK